MERREFLSGASSVLAVGLTLPVINLDPASLGHDPSDEDIEGYLARVDERLSHVGRKALPAFVGEHLQAKGLHPDLPHDLWRTTMLSAALQGLPTKARQHPRYDETVKRDGARGMHAILSLADAVESMEQEELEGIGKALRDEPQLLGRLFQDTFAHCEGHGVPKQHLRQGVRALDDMAWKLAHQSPSAVMRRELAAFDKACRSNGFERKDWQAHFVKSPGSSGALQKGLSPQDDAEKDQDIDSDKAGEAYKGVLVAGGLALAGSATSFLVAGLVHAMDAAILLMFNSCLLAVGGVILLLVGAILFASARRKAKG